MAEMAKKLMKKLEEEVENKGLKLSVTENGKEGKSKMIASCGFLKDELRQCSKEEGVTMADSVETLGGDLRTRRVKRLGAKEKARRKECQVRFSLFKKNKVFQKELRESGGKEVVTSGYGTSEGSGFGRHRKIELEEANGSGKNEYDLVVPFLGGLWSGGGGRSLYCGHPVLGRKSLDW